MPKYLLLSALFLGILISGFLLTRNKNLPPQQTTNYLPSLSPSAVIIPTPIPTPNPTPTPVPQPKLSDVPFTVQSPFAQWSDPRQQDGCEEASVLMVMHWVKDEPILSKQAALDEILKISHYQDDNYGGFHDTSAQDTAERLIKGYYHYDNYQVKDINNADHIIAELNQGAVIIVPTDGQFLAQPNFTAPGPERHMLVIKSYDASSGQFITNDPGISQGQNWKYKKEILFNAIRDYATGDHAPIVGVEKRMIVVKR